MKHLIVNADDFGASRGINRGIIEAHRRGILTSTSLMVLTPFSTDAAKLAKTEPRLSVGWHADLPEALQDSPKRAGEELERQFSRFMELMGVRPTHLDSHHNVHRKPQLLPVFLETAAAQGLPLREHSPVRYFPNFYGQWGGESHPEQISAENLARMFKTRIGEGITELSCHPGWMDRSFVSGYASERELELQTLCDPMLRRVLADQEIVLVSYHDLAGLLVAAAT